MMRDCDVCGETYEAKRRTSRYCSTRCRTKASRAGGVPRGVVKMPKAPASQPDSPEPLTHSGVGGEGGVTGATREALEAAGREATPLGQACIALARRLDDPGTDTGSAMAAVAKQLEAMLASATKGATSTAAPDQLRDELAERRRAHA